MVAMMQTFGNCEIKTPHGGAPFQGWRKGFGFGHSAGPGNHVLHPSMAQELRYTPKGDRGLASNPFWRKKWELGQASSFGIGERPDYGNARDADIAPNTYGDVAPAVSKVRRNSTRAGMTLKARFPSVEEKQRDLSWPQCGPGPGKYDTTTKTGQSSWVSPAANPSWSFGPRLGGMMSEIKESLGKPGPGAHNCITTPGQNNPIRRGTLYDISMKGRAKHHKPGGGIPGPGAYKLIGELERYGLDRKIAAVRVQRRRENSSWDSGLPATPTYEYEGHLSGLQEESGDASSASGTAREVVAEGYAADHAEDAEDEPSEASSPQHTLTRVESSPI
eukprot:gb/GFBE01006624.1/.p1 GENE.gb/GFBE01006624.1/~~gb/GFBE01006624.1/.p1  ORF type:complete len:333 (+),score=63.61 gb/GFBE01006624.1/:1-999(+)